MAQRNGWILGWIFFGERGRKLWLPTLNFWTFQKLNQHSRWWFPIFLLSSLPGEGFHSDSYFSYEVKIFPIVLLGKLPVQVVSSKSVISAAEIWDPEACTFDPEKRHVALVVVPLNDTCLGERRGVDDAHVSRNQNGGF